ncbi:MAG TPA: glycosyltransferase family 9 protein [Stellaceae bacterium]|jgi:ADP-heptose:LPS heptosyltransferase
MNILFVTATRIGDAVLSTGLLSFLLDRHPEARFTIAAGPLAAPLFADAPRVERVIAVTKQAASLHWLKLYAAVAGRRWDLIVDLRGSALAWLLRAGERKVAAKEGVDTHRVRHLGALFGLNPPPNPTLWLGADTLAKAGRLVPPGPPVVAIGPAANWRGKQWRGERFAELAQRLTAPSGAFDGARVAVLAAAHERPQAGNLLCALPPDRVIDLVGRTDVLTAAGVVRSADMFIGNDTGLMHIAAAVGTPTLGLFGPSPAARYAPWGRCTAIVQTDRTPAELMGPGFDHRTTDTLMDSLSVERVEAAVRALRRRAEAA